MTHFLILFRQPQLQTLGYLDLLLIVTKSQHIIHQELNQIRVIKPVPLYPDTTVPSTPLSLTATPVSTTQINL